MTCASISIFFCFLWGRKMFSVKHKSPSFTIKKAEGRGRKGGERRDIREQGEWDGSGHSGGSEERQDGKAEG